ncbi:MAG TPA: AgmX/PglI C-terminal domain-containing protein [Kofleriaceae bacterium]|nr:AgmX/PglI C-terminal domain-containing protein [Kofleriaceae bacterium]
MRTIASTVLFGCLVIAAAACGGKSKGPSEPSPDSGGGEVGEADDDAEAGDSSMVPPETMDEISSLLDRKRPAAARCLADAVLAGKAPKNARGRVNLAFVIGANGKAREIKIIESSIKNDTVEACVVEKVESIDFPSLPKDLEWSYAYAFESM